MSAPDLAGMDPHARRFLAMVAVGARNSGKTPIAERRRSFGELMRFSKPPASAAETQDLVIPSVAGGIPARAYAATRGVLPAVIYFHGGGLVAGSIDTHDALCRTIACEAQCRVISVGYRLAPEHPFPAAIVDALVATRWICRNAPDLSCHREATAIAGDSGGATLAAIVSRVLHRRFAFRAQVLLCPVLDFAASHPSKEAYSDGFLLDEATMARDRADYASKRAVTDPHISPLRAKSFTGLPPAIIHTAGYDPLRDEGTAFAAALREAGVHVEETCHEALIHHFYALTGAIPAAKTALSAIAADIRHALS